MPNGTGCEEDSSFKADSDANRTRVGNRTGAKGNRTGLIGTGSGAAWDAHRGVLRKRVAKAREYRRLLDDKLFRSMEKLAAHEGLTGVRIGQILGLLNLAPEIVADLENPDGRGPVPTESLLRGLLKLDSDEQARRYRTFIADQERQETAARPPRRSGFQHLFDRARHFHEMMTTGGMRAMADVGVAEGITPTRVRHLLMLLQLPVDILRRLDVPQEEVPPGITERDLRWISTARGESEQRRRWETALGRSADAK